MVVCFGREATGAICMLVVTGVGAVEGGDGVGSEEGEGDVGSTDGGAASLASMIIRSKALLVHPPFRR